jgi:hypothetical protein
MLVTYYRQGRLTGGPFGGVQSKTMGQVSVSFAGAAGSATTPYPGDPALPLDVIGRLGAWKSRDV